jgi:hypothetical protein
LAIFSRVAGRDDFADEAVDAGRCADGADAVAASESPTVAQCTSDMVSWAIAACGICPSKVTDDKVFLLLEKVVAHRHPLWVV